MTKLFFALVLLSVILIIFRVIRNGKRKQTLRIKDTHNAMHFLPALVILGALTFIVWLSQRFYLAGSYFELIALLVLLVILCFPFVGLFKDLMMGMVFKIQNKVIKGKHIEIENIEGRISKVGLLGIEIMDASGNINTLPYHGLFSKTITRQSENQNLEKITLRFSFPETKKTNELTTKLLQLIMTTPWVAVSQQPSIENISHSDGKLWIEICAFTLDKAYAENIQSMVENHLKKTLNITD